LAHDKAVFMQVRMFANGMRVALEQADLTQINENALVKKHYIRYLNEMQIFSYVSSIKDAHKMKISLQLYM